MRARWSSAGTARAPQRARLVPPPYTHRLSTTLWRASPARAGTSPQRPAVSAQVGEGSPPRARERASERERERAGERASERASEAMSVTEADVLAAANKYDVADVLVLPLARRQLGGSGMGLRAALLRCERLEELDLTGNALESLEWLGGLPAAATLRKLTLTQNGLASLKGAGALNSLEHLMVQANCLRGVDDLALDELASLPSLHSLYLANVDGSQPNPACSDPGYRAAVLGALPKLRILDGERLDGPGSAALREACGSHAGMGLDELDAAASGAEEDFVAAHARAEAELADAADLDAMLRGGACRTRLRGTCAHARASDKRTPAHTSHRCARRSAAGPRRWRRARWRGRAPRRAPCRELGARVACEGGRARGRAPQRRRRRPRGRCRARAAGRPRRSARVSSRAPTYTALADRPTHHVIFVHNLLGHRGALVAVCVCARG